MKHFLDKSKLQEIKGKRFTAEELLNLFGYSKKTILADTKLTEFVKRVDTSPLHYSKSAIYEVI